MIAQFKDPLTKSRPLSSYQSIVQDGRDGYDSDFTANTQNSDGTFVFIADTEFNANASVNSNGEMEGTPSELTVNAAASKCILRKSFKRTIPRSSQMSSGAPAKMLANE